MHAAKGKQMQVKDLKPAGYNPRKITKAQLERLKKSLQEFGDLSGIVFNVRTQRLIGGHQRIKNFSPDWGIVKKPHTDKTGTVATGYIETPSGRMSYREVDWPEDKEKKANIAANKHGGEFDDDLLKQLLDDMKIVETDLDIELIGFDDSTILKYIKQNEEPEDNQDKIIVKDKDPNILIRVSLHPGIWLGKREEIIEILEKMKKTYGCEVKIEE